MELTSFRLNGLTFKIATRPGLVPRIWEEVTIVALKRQTDFRAGNPDKPASKAISCIAIEGNSGHNNRGLKGAGNRFRCR